uniref:ADP-ribose glycohydrolase OARD1 n=5 Tax=Aves TaxID=8782 RepID=A0A8C4K785_DRONO
TVSHPEATLLRWHKFPGQTPSACSCDRCPRRTGHPHKARDRAALKRQHGPRPSLLLLDRGQREVSVCRSWPPYQSKSGRSPRDVFILLQSHRREDFRCGQRPRRGRQGEDKRPAARRGTASPVAGGIWRPGSAPDPSAHAPLGTAEEVFTIAHVTMATHFFKDQGERIKCVKGDLFSCPQTDSLAHCISEDCRMGAGIAVLFKKKFGGVQELLDQQKKTGEVAVLQRDDRYIYYLITKKKVSHKPTYENMRKSLEAMKTHCLNNGVTDISMPRIGCGLDRLDWNKVSAILGEVFEDTDIKITVYTL